MATFRLNPEMPPPAGDQPQAIDELVEGIEGGELALSLLGVTGSGKTRTMAGVMERLARPALVMAPNKTLAAQLTNEFKELFPDTAVEYFVSYYDYYQPEAYIPQSDTYIEKDSSMNEEIDRLRHSATSALLTRRDVIIVASVSAIYGLGSPEEYREQMLFLKVGEEYDRDEILRKLVDIHYDRNDLNFVRGKFRVRGDTLEVFPAYEERAMRIELFGDQVERILVMDPVTGEIVGERDELLVFPASHYVAGSARMERAIAGIEAELAERLAELEREGKLLEAQRLRMRTTYDLEMLREVGVCNGIENYSRHIDGRSAGTPPFTLLDYFPDDFVLFVDESHVTVPQIGGMYEGDRSRKVTLVEHGFRLPSALDNRPLRFDEFLDRIGQRVFVSATPGPYELRESTRVVQQIIRPTGLVDPEVVVRPTKGQVDDLIHEIKLRADKDQRILVTTLTKKMAEDLTDYLLEMGLRVRYLHSEIDTVQRIEILRDLRLGEFDALIGINLLREGLDLPEVTLVAILDADKEGFLRSETSLVQTIGRAARNVDGQVIMYADEVTPSMRRAIDETNRRRKLQVEYNQANGIDPQTVRKRVTDIIQALRGEEEGVAAGGRPRKGRAPRPARGRAGRRGGEPAVAGMPKDDLVRLITSLEEEMHEAAKDLRFEYAARLRDEVADLRRELRVMTEVGVG
jgi:excinuclease ABC subunit B